MSQCPENKTWFLHVDLDAFFASVEQLDNPSYRGKPVIVGGNPNEKRSVVSTASYEARAFGVHSAMPGFQAYKLCPQGIFVHPRMERYEELSYQIMSIFKDFSPDVQQMSIDEAFIDLTGTEKLFGPPEETAIKIKERVKNETGLTVSIGLAATKYIAKIASGYKKPDGFFFVKPGEEKAFMEKLPLNKVWGIGQKSLEMLNKGGIYSTKDILERDYETLEFQFGKNTADFLFDVMHNGGANVFKTERKSHSISAEETFPVDITSSYSAQTVLLQLAHEVYFRLLREESYSKTAVVKIRYNDFKTLSVQKTLTSNIMNLDSFFEVIKELFEKKYDGKSGIRLLGVGLDNVTKAESPQQQSLFDDGSQKKQAIEKAILSLEKKHPEIKIQKARTLKRLKGLLLFGLLSGAGSLFTKGGAFPSGNLYAQTNSSVEAKGAGSTLPSAFPDLVVNNNPETLYDWDLNDKNHVEFSIKGWWQGLFEESLVWSFGGADDSSQNGAQNTFSPGRPVFKQAVDLTALVNLNNSWFFEASFSDEFKKNTYAVTWRGQGYLRQARLSNRGINMLSSYSAETFGYALKGGNNQAPGLSLHFEDFLDDRWAADFIFRYDMTKTKSATFYGMNSVTDLQIELKDYMAGSRFVIPESASSALSDIKDIYVENSSGSYTDKNKKKFKKLSTSDYMILESQNMIILASSANASRQNGKTPTLLVTFNSAATVNMIDSQTGAYDDEQSFAGKIQKFFNEHTQKEIKLSDYAGPRTGSIEGSDALVLQNSTGFSPYLCASYYDLGITKDADISLIYKNNEKEADGFLIEEVTENFSAIRDDFFSVNHKFARIIQLSRQSKSLQEPWNRFPMGSENPEIYLNLKAGTDTVILVRSYSPVSEFLIGTSAAGGTVLVYKNGILDTGAKFYPENGKVELSSGVGTTDKITIIWQEDNSNFGSGSLSTGAGLIYNFTDNFKGDLALTATLPLSFGEKYSVQSNLKPGFAALSGGLEYSKEWFSISEKAAASVNTQNAAENLLVNEQKNYLPQTYYLASSSGYATKAEPYITEAKIQLSSADNGTIIKHGGETESGISGYKIPLSWNFSSITGRAWAAVDIKLASGNLLSSSDQLEVALKPDFALKDKNSYELYLQLGVKAESDFTGEDSDKISSWKITEKSDNVLIPLDLSLQKWQTIKISLSDENRAKLSSNYDARIILLQKNEAAAAGDTSGKIYAGPYRPFVKSIYTLSSSLLTVNATSQKNNSTPAADELKKKENYSSIINWNYTAESVTSPSQTKITAISYFEAADFSNYGEINFDFAYVGRNLKTASLNEPENEEFLFILDNSAISAASEGKKGVKVSIKNLKNYVSESLIWNRLTIDLTENEVLINGNKISAQDASLEINSKNIPDRMKIVFDTNINKTLYQSGSFYIDNLFYKGSSINLTGQHYTKIQFKQKENDDEKALVKNAEFILESRQSGGQALKNAPRDAAKQGSVTSSAKGGVTLAGINLSGDLTLSHSSNDTDSNIFKNAGHSIKTEKELAGIFSFEESYRYNHDDKNLKKTNSLSADFSSVKVPVKIAAKTEAKNAWSTQSQNSSFIFTTKPGIFEFSQEAGFSQKINTKKSQSKTFNTNNYFQGWTDISLFALSDGDKSAIFRNEKYKSSAAVKLALADMKPSISYELNSSITNSYEYLFSDSEGFTFSLPFSLGKSSLKFTASKLAGGSQDMLLSSNLENTYLEDTKELLKKQGERSYLYKTIPFYDFFQKDLKDSIQKEKNASTQRLTYSTKYETSWNRRLFNTPKDLFIPSFVTFGLARDLASATKESDIRQYRISITNNSINNFGRESFNPLFTWYARDEVITSLTGILKVPDDLPQNTSWTLSGYIQVLLFINDSNTLKTALDGSIETNANYSGKATLIWQRKGYTTPVVELAKFISKKAAQTDFSISRKETLNFEISKADLIKKQVYSYAHSVEAKFLKHYTISTGLGIDFKYFSNSANLLSLNFSIGGKAEF